MLALSRTISSKPALRRVALVVNRQFAGTPESEVVVKNLKEVQAKVHAAAQARQGYGKNVRLVAVSKTKPVEAIKAAYDAGHRHFGENYVQELVAKAPALPNDIEWHFIGTLQSNKVAQLLKVVGASLACVETVGTPKLARALDKAARALSASQKLKIMIQVNTSGEESKGGVEPDLCAELARTISKECAGLEIAGLMTIGAPDYSGCRSEDFESLRKCRREVAEVLSISEDDLELSMGMSNDFETAIGQGSTSVRVGSQIFGARDYTVKK